VVKRMNNPINQRKVARKRKMLTSNRTTELVLVDLAAQTSSTRA